MPTLTFTSDMPVPAADLFAWHDRPGAFMRLAPPWAPVQLERFEGIRDGQQAVIRLGIPPATLRWVAEHRNYVTGEQFQDVQLKGPFARWAHTHRMEPVDDATSRLVDYIEYAVPLGRLGETVGGSLIRKQLHGQFAYRHRITRNDLTLHHRYNPDGKRLRIAVTGASGLIGSALVGFMQTGGHEVLRLVRTKPVGEGEVYWNIRAGEIDASALEGLDAFIHLAGENVFAWRWSEAKKQRILESRTQGTRLLAEALAQLDTPPATFISASGIGYYGDTGGEAVDEQALRNADGFLADVVRQWEAAADPARQAGIRTVHPRIGIVLSPKGGALKQMLSPFKLGGGGTIGAAHLNMSWIALDDVIGALYHALWTPALSGPVNLTAPNPATMRTFAKTLASVLKRPSWTHVPGGALKLAMGEVAEETLLKSIRAVPSRLQGTNYTFLFPDLREALAHQLGRTLDGVTMETT
ncbi:MAG: TIGR01777 family oxidoreductase [Rhodothermales bacterium]